MTVPFGDIQTLDQLGSIGITPEVLEQKGEKDLVALRRYLFASRRPPERTSAGDVRLFSAPGEGRECVEIARRILEEARDGVAFDEIADLRAVAAALRQPSRARLHACRDSRVVRSRHQPAAPGGPGVSRHSCLRVRKVIGAPLRRVPLARAGAAINGSTPRIRFHRSGR